MAGHSAELQNALADAAAKNSGAFYVAAHTADPGTTGTNEVSGGSYARQQSTPPNATNGSSQFPAAVLNIPAGNKVTHWARYKTASGGTPYDSGTVNGATGVSFDINGTLTINLTVAPVPGS